MSDTDLAAANGTPHPAAIDSLLGARHGDPYSLLGPHSVEADVSVRLFLPDAARVVITGRDTGAVLTEMHRLRGEGLFVGRIPAATAYRLRVTDYAGIVREIDDTYAFPSSLGDLDVYLLAEGRHRDLGDVLGAHPMTAADTWGNAVEGTRFAVWAPNARRVSVVGSFNGWDGRVSPMRRHFECGVWELFVPGVGTGALYKYEIVGPDGALLPLRADPCAWAAQRPPQTASIVAALDTRWTDADWMQSRGARQRPDAPISIYEMHATSWLPGGENATRTWDALADRLLPYIVEMGFTHIELMPVMEHPFGGSWGYQPLGQFAPNSRLGEPEGFARFVDRAHAANIGVILDWVPAHFPTDAHGLARFDGTALYEHEDPREGFHQDWNTAIYNLGRNEVRGFMIASALFWLKHYHIDGLRVDAVASMLYRDYSRREGEWIPNQYGGRENLESIAFLQDLSRAVRQDAPGAVLIAEESTAFPGVTRPADEGGLGFDYKWNMGWMHDTLHYIEQPPIYRRWAHGEISFGLVYAFSERFVLPLSHDEVVYGKGSMIGKMPGDHWQRFANLRAYYGFMWAHPGKKLLFMGGEFAQQREWDHDSGLDWSELDHADNRGMQRLISDLNGRYRGLPALHQRDTEGTGFTWLKLHDAEASVFAWLRHGKDGTPPVLVVCNFTPVPRYDYRVGVPVPRQWAEIVNTDSERYGGSNVGNAGAAWADGPAWDDQPHSLALTLPPLATLYLTPANAQAIS